MLQVFENIGYFLAVIVVVVLIHELGHYLVARWCGIAVRVFSVGFGREIFGWNNKTGTRFCLASIPLGGYVRMEGWTQQELEEMPPQRRSEGFMGKPLWAKMLVVAAGPVANFVLAILIFSVLYATQGAPVIDKEEGIPIGEVIAGSAAEQAGLRAGDRILRVDGEEIDRFSTLARIIEESGGRKLVLSILRENQLLQLEARPQILENENKYRIGVRLADGRIEQLGLARAVWRATSDSIALSREILVAIKELIAGTRSTDELSGPVRLAQISGEAGRAGIAIFFSFTAILSINLGLLNLLPIPMLDGGHLMFYSIELVRRKPLSEKLQQMLSFCGLAMLAALMLWVTGQDILRIIIPSVP